MNTPEQLTPAELVTRRESGELWQVLDVREQWEIDIVNVADSIRIPMGTLPERYSELAAEQPVAVLCHSGVRSNRVAHWLVENGFGRVANIVGGIDAWAMTIDPTLARY